MRQRHGWVVPSGLLVTGLSMLVFGFWAWTSPDSFAKFHRFRDAHALPSRRRRFQIGIGAALLLSLALRDAPTVTLAAFVIANTLHTVNHGIDLHIGGEPAAIYGLGALSLIGAIALAVRVTALRRHSRLQRELTPSTLAPGDQPGATYGA